MQFPSQAAWAYEGSEYTSYPLIVDGRVFFVTSIGVGLYGVNLFALDARTGRKIWGPVEVQGVYQNSNLAYDRGKIFVTNQAAVLRAFDAATGSLLWEKALEGNQGIAASLPTAVNGTVYVGQGHGWLYAVDEDTGSIKWQQSVAYGDVSAPAVTTDGVYVAYPCHYYKFNPTTGAQIWLHLLGCEGGGGRTPVTQGSRVIIRDDTTGPNGQVLSTQDGTLQYSLWLGTIPSVDDAKMYSVGNGILTAVDIATGQERWSFSQDGQLVTNTLLIDNYVIVGSQTGAVYALDAATGSQVWRGDAGATMSMSEQNGLAVPYRGLASAEHMLVVTTDKGLTAWSLDGG